MKTQRRFAPTGGQLAPESVASITGICRRAITDRCPLLMTVLARYFDLVIALVTIQKLFNTNDFQEPQYSYESGKTPSFFSRKWDEISV
jgi:hypothetical protein